MRKTFFEIFKMKLHETLLFLNKNKKFVLKMQSLRAAKRSMRTRPGVRLRMELLDCKAAYFFLLSQKLPYNKVNFKIT